MLFCAELSVQELFTKFNKLLVCQMNCLIVVVAVVGLEPVSYTHLTLPTRG